VAAVAGLVVVFIRLRLDHRVPPTQLS
jgi:hypothetical protein